MLNINKIENLSVIDGNKHRFNIIRLFDYLYAYINNIKVHKADNRSILCLKHMRRVAKVMKSLNLEQN